jgi:hypothetical protein
VQSWVRILVEPESSNALANGWRMASLKAFFDQLLVEQSTTALAAYVAAALILVASTTWLWMNRCHPIPVAFGLTSLIAVLFDPHLVDYDLSVLVGAGVLLIRNRTLAWMSVAVYMAVVLRLQIPVGGTIVLVTPLLLCVCAYLIWRDGLVAERGGRRTTQICAEDRGLTATEHLDE